MERYSSTDIVIPIFNESATVEELVRRLRESCPGATLIFVDNGSTDATLELLEAQGELELIRHDRNLGYGQSLIDGIRAGGRKYVVVIDADLEYQPEDIPALVKGLESNDAVIGSRFLRRHDRVVDMPWARVVGNRVVTALFNAFFGQRLTDLYTGVRAFRRSALNDNYNCTGFEFVLEVSAQLAKAGARIGEVPAAYHPREAGSSKMRHITDFLIFSYWLFRFRFSR